MEQLVPGLDVFVVGSEQQPTWENRSAAELPAVSPSDLAYVAYTSGSTDKPREVLIEHRSFGSAATPGAREFSVFPDSRVISLLTDNVDGIVQAAAAQCNISQLMIEDAYPCIPL